MDVLRMKKKRKQVSLLTESRTLGAALGGLPAEDECVKIVSFCGVSAAGFLQYVADLTVIHDLQIATFRVGPRARKLFESLHAQGRIEKARFVVGRLMAQSARGGTEKRYFEELGAVCAKHGWPLISRANHAKVMLFDTDEGKFVLETSGNLNEAPNWEQFSFERDGALYGFYCAALDEMFSQADAAAMQAVTGAPAAAAVAPRQWGAIKAPLW